MAVKFANNVSTTLSAAINATQTTISVADASGLPTLSSGDYIYLTIDTDTNSPTIEVVKVTAISSNTLTVVRGQDGTTASSFSNGTKIELRVTAAALDDISSAADTESVSIDGDTMTGDLTINSTTLKIAGDFPRIYLEDTAGSDQDAYIANNANGLFFGKTNSPSASNDILTLNLSNSSATFAGNLSLSGTGNKDVYLGVSGSTEAAYISRYNNDFYVMNKDGGDLIFGTNNSNKGRFTSSGAFQMGTTTVIDSSRNLTNIGTISAGAITSSDKISASSDLETATRLKFTNNIANGWSAPIIFRESAHLALSDYSGVKLGGYNGTDYGPRVHVAGNGNVNLLEGSLMIAGTVVIDSSRNFIPYQIRAANGDDTPLGTQFSNVIKGQGTNRTIYFDGNGTSVSTWYGVGNNPYAAIDCTDGMLDVWINDSAGNWLNVADFATGGLNITYGGFKIGSTTVIDSSRNVYANYSLLGRGFRASNRGELHLNATG